MADRYPGFLQPDDAGPEGETLEQCTPLAWPGLDSVSGEFVASLLSRLLAASYRSPDLLSLFALRKAALTKLLVFAKEALAREPTVVDVVVPPHGRAHVFGDTHGDLHSLVEALSLADWPASDNVLCFAGDCVDRGAWGVEVMVIVLALKLWRPDCVFLLRGNHETTGCVSRYGFEKEVVRKYDERVFSTFVLTFRELPCAAVIRTLPHSVGSTGASDTVNNGASLSSSKRANRRSNRSRRGFTVATGSDAIPRGECWRALPVPGERRVLVMHGGLFRSWKAKKARSMELGNLNDLAETHRQVDDPHESIIEDVIWSDPQTDANDVAPNALRGAGILYGQGAVEAFFKRNHLHGLIRAHEGPDMREKRPNMADMLEGYSLDMELVSGYLATVFSSAAYPPDKPRSNKGAFATLHGADVERMQMLPKFTQFEKRFSPSDSFLFYTPSDEDLSATPRSSIS